MPAATLGITLRCTLALALAQVPAALAWVLPLPGWARAPAAGLIGLLAALPLITGWAVAPHLRERDAAARALERNARELGRVLSSTHDGILTLDTQGRATYVNPAAARMLGWPAGELLGRRQHELLHHSRPDGSPFPVEQCAMCNAYRDGVPQRVDDEVLFRRDGTALAVEYVTNPLVDEDGRVTGAVVSFRDTAERRAAEAALRRNLDELERINRLAVGRELRMRELKDEVDALCAELGRPPRYPRPAAVPEP